MLELNGVALAHPRGGSPLVTDATLTVGPGQVALIVAASGLGSSRIVATILGEARCAAGHISVLGRDVGKLQRSSLRQLRRRVGVVPQDLCLLEERSAQLNAVMPLEIDGVPRSTSIARATEILEQLGLGDEAALPVEMLSRAARQRVAVARALIRQPELILADHPTSDQDSMGAQLVCDALGQAVAGGASCVIFGRDPMLRVQAAVMGWSQWFLAGGKLRPLHEAASQADQLDDLLITMDSAPVAWAAEPAPELSNVLPFPGPARAVGAR
jgi:ABC-type ATPase involved in cell division